MRILAVSVDPPETTRDLIAKQGYTFTFLADPKMEVIRRYDLVHEKGRRNSTDIARPAEYLIDPGGTIRWANFTENYKVRVKGQEILAMLDELGVK